MKYLQNKYAMPVKLDDMQCILPVFEIQVPPSLMLHRHGVALFAFQSLLCSFDALAHSCASHPLSCKCSAHLGLSAMITTLAVCQA